MARSLERYESFLNIDCAAKCARVMEALMVHIEAGDNPFWTYFMKKREQHHAEHLDDLRVLHSYLPTIREILDEKGDAHALALLADLEESCM